MSYLSNLLAPYGCVLVLSIGLLFGADAGVTRKELYDELAFKQISRNTFDSRVHQKVKPIGFVGEKPIWPRILDRVKSSAELFFDDDNFAYQVRHLGPEHLIRQIESTNNYDKVIDFLNKWIGETPFEETPDKESE